MREKLGKGSYKKKTQTTSSSSACIPVKKRGRPKGSKNKPKTDTAPVSPEPAPIAKKRGRPKGSKNKVYVQPELAAAQPVAEAKKRGRPKGSKNKTTLAAVIKSHESLKEPVTVTRRPISASTDITTVHPAVQPIAEEHPLQIAASWIEKNMHPSEVQYYRSRANRTGTSLRCAMMSDMLGFFNVKDTEINKQVKKNNFIVTPISSHGLHD
jgi:hypothetical protein